MTTAGLPFPLFYSAILNPSIIAASDVEVYDYEVCLSIPHLAGFVPRREWIEVSFYGLDGVERRSKLEDISARVFQHELDHLNGLVYLDRVTQTKVG